MGVGGGGVRIEDDAESMFRVLGKGHRFWDEITETFDRKKGRGREVEIHDEDSDSGDGGEGWGGGRGGEKGGQTWGREGRD